MYMDTITSTAFRTHYARLTEPTLVTVNGHVIGQWTPGGMSDESLVQDAIERRRGRPLASYRSLDTFGVSRPAPKRR